MIEILVIIGLFFLAVGTIGLIRLEDTYSRMHATSKATTLGTGFIVLAGVAEFFPSSASLQAVTIVVFLFLTAPTGAHLIARANYKKNSKDKQREDKKGESLGEYL